MSRIALLLFPGVTQLDLTAPYEVFSRLPGLQVHLVAETLEAVQTEHGMRILPDTLRETCPPVDLLCIPGGGGIHGLLESDAWLDFVAKQGAQAQYVTSVCTGSLVLGAAGLLQGYRATSHWLSLDLLKLCGAEPVKARVVKDRNRISGGGVTAGIDFALSLAAELSGKEKAEEIQLMMEYSPEPPFDAGSPDRAPQDLVQELRAARSEFQKRREAIFLEALKRRGL